MLRLELAWFFEKSLCGHRKKLHRIGRSVTIHHPFPSFCRLPSYVLVSCQAITAASCLSFCLAAALLLQLHNAAMLPQSRLAGKQNYFATLRHSSLDMTRDRGQIYLFLATFLRRDKMSRIYLAYKGTGLNEY